MPIYFLSRMKKTWRAAYFQPRSDEDEINNFGVVQEQPFFAAGAFGLLTPSKALNEHVEEVKPRNRGHSIDVSLELLLHPHS